jgi:hypothetical protein
MANDETTAAVALRSVRDARGLTEMVRGAPLVWRRLASVRVLKGWPSRRSFTIGGGTP